MAIKKQIIKRISKMKRLNKTERNAIISKIVNTTMDNYEKKVQEIKDAYVPDENYHRVQHLYELVNSCFQQLGDLGVINKSNYNHYYLNNNGDLFDVDYKMKEYVNSHVEIPESPMIMREEIDQELILNGISEDFDLTKFINSKVLTY